MLSLCLLIKFDEYWDESNPKAEISTREKKCGWEFSKKKKRKENVAEVSVREKENVAEILAKEKENG